MGVFSKVKKAAKSPFKVAKKAANKAFSLPGKLAGSALKGLGKVVGEISGANALTREMRRQSDMLAQQEAGFLASEAEEDARRKRRQSNILRSGLATTPSLFDILGTSQ